MQKKRSTLKKAVSTPRSLNEERYQVLIDSMKDVVFETDTAGRFTFLSGVWAEMLGYPIQESLGHEWVFYVDEEDAERLRSSLEQVLSGKSPAARHPLRLRAIDDRGLWLEAYIRPRRDDAGSIIGTLGTLRDVSLYRLQQESLKKERDFTNTVIHTVSSLVIVLDREGRIVRFNRACEKITGYRAEEVIGRKFFEFLLPPEAVEGVRAGFERLVGGAVPEKAENEWVTRQGDRRLIAWTNAVVLDQDGEVTFIIGTGEDVTERQGQERELRASKERYELALRGSRDGIWDWDLTTNLTNFSPRWKTMLGYREDELDNTVETWKRLLHPEDQPRVQEELGAYLRGESPLYECEFRMLCKSGDYKWILARGVAVRDEEGRPCRMAGSHTDIDARKQADEAVQRSQRMLNEAQSLTKLGSWEYDLETQRITWTEETFRILGRPIELGEPDFNENLALYAPQSADELVRVVQECLETGAPYDLDLETAGVLTPVKICRAKGRPIYDELGRMVKLMGTLQDVTEQRVAEAEQRRLLEIIENTPDMIGMSYPDGRVYFLNRAFREAIGVDTIEDISAAHPAWALERVLQEGIPSALVYGSWQGESALLSADGDEVPVSQVILRHDRPDGEVGLISTICRDITAAKVAQERIERSEALLIETQRLAQVGSWEIDVATGIITWSDATFEIFERPRELGSPTLHEYVTQIVPGHHELVAEVYRGAVEEGKTVDYQVDIWVPSGITKRLRIMGRPIRDELGSVVRITGSVQDISAQQRVEEALVAAKERALEHSRLKSQFLANMSHEIRTPMNGILSAADLLMFTGLNEEQRTYARTIQRSGESLLSIINDILDFSKIEAGRMEVESQPYRPSEVFATAVTLLEPRAKAKGLQLSVRSDIADSAFLLGDATRLGQVVTNLLSNALKFTDHGEVALECRQQGDRLRFDIVDTGIGIAADRVAHVFDSFTQADGSTTRRYGGTGLGLSIVKELVTLMGGEVGLESELGKGSRFWVELPWNEADPVEAEKSDVVAGSHWPSLKVLVVDDNEVNRLVARKMLRSLGASCDEASDGEEAVAKALSNPYDLVFMDVQMPKLDGMEATRQIRENELGHMLIVAVTAHALQGDREQCLAAGMDDYITKPFRRNEIIELLQQRLKPMEQTPSVIHLDVLESISDGDRAFERDVLDAYVEAASEHVARLSEVLETRDWAQVRALAHTLKGSSRSIGAESFGHLAEALEQSARAEDADAATDAARRLIDAHPNVVAEAKRLIQERAA